MVQRKTIKDLKQLSLEDVNELITQGKIKQVSNPCIFTDYLRKQGITKDFVKLRSYEEGLEKFINSDDYCPEFGPGGRIIKGGVLDANAYMMGPTPVFGADFGDGINSKTIAYPITFYKIEED